MELIAVILTLICVILTIKSNILCWPFSIISSIAYMYVFGVQHIYFQFIVQIIFIIQSIHGWYYWHRVKELRIEDDSVSNLITHLFIVGMLTMIATKYMQGKTNNPELMLDILTTLLSLLGTWYLAIRNIFAWMVWIIADIFFCVMFIREGMYWSLGLYMVLTLLAINGLKQWEKLLKTA